MRMSFTEMMMDVTTTFCLALSAAASIKHLDGTSSVLIRARSDGSSNKVGWCMSFLTSALLYIPSASPRLFMVSSVEACSHPHAFSFPASVSSIRAVCPNRV